MRSLLLVLTVLLAATTVSAQSTVPEDSDLVRAIFPWCEEFTLEQNFRVVSSSKYKVYLSGGPIQSALLGKDGNAEYFAAAVAFGQGDDLEHYYWYNQVVIAVIKRVGKKMTLVHKTKLLNEGQYMHRVEQIKLVNLNNRPVALLEYRYSDSVSTPRGWHTITKLFGLTGTFTLEELWTFETAFVRPAAASLPSVNKQVLYHFVDYDGDGDDDIVTSATLTKANLWTKYRWEKGQLIKSESNE